MMVYNYMHAAAYLELRIRQFIQTTPYFRPKGAQDELDFPTEEETGLWLDCGIFSTKSELVPMSEMST